MEDLLSMGSILSEDEAAKLFDDNTTSEKEDTKPESKELTLEENTATTEVNPDDLFEEEPESVGSKEKSGSQESTPSSDKEGGTSPNTTENFYSSIATALKDEGVFPDLDDSELESIKEPEDFVNVINKLIDARLTETQKRINDALQANVPPDAIKLYEGTIQYLDSITEDALSAESDLGERVRKLILLQDFLNRGYTPERAARLTEKLFDSGEDIDEAKAALLSNKDYFKSKYKALLDEHRNKEELERKAIKKQTEDLRKSILDNDKAFGSISLDKSSRQKVFDTISKPVWKDPDTGEYYTAIQKYRKDNPNDFIRNVGYLYTLTNGFKDIEGLVKPQTKKEIKSKLRELEHTLNNTARTDGGVLKYVGNDNKGTIFDLGLALDIKL